MSKTKSSTPKRGRQLLLLVALLVCLALAVTSALRPDQRVPPADDYLPMLRSSIASADFFSASSTCLRMEQLGGVPAVAVADCITALVTNAKSASRHDPVEALEAAARLAPGDAKIAADLEAARARWLQLLESEEQAEAKKRVDCKQAFADEKGSMGSCIKSRCERFAPGDKRSQCFDACAKRQSLTFQGCYRELMNAWNEGVDGL